MTLREPAKEPDRKPEPAAEPKPERSWRDLLERIHLLPPSSEETTEVRLASWWATRVGIVLGVIASVFFGVHVSQDASPALRLAMLAGVAFTLLGVGLWIERKLKAFGQVLAAGGLAIFYVTAFAAYAFEPMKVVENPAIGLLLQLLGVAAMAGFSIWKRAEPLGTIAILLGYVSCWFSHTESLHSFTIGGLLMLAIAASALFFTLRWAAPFAVAMVGGYVGYVLLIPFRWAVPGLGSPGFEWVLGAAIALLLIFHLTLSAVHLLRGSIPENWRVTGVIANSAMAITAGLFAVAALHVESISWAYLVFGIVFFGAAALEFWKPRSNRLTSLLFLQSMAGFALFSIYEFVGPTEWLALGMQSLILAVALIWSRSRALEFSSFALWVGAFWLFVRDIFQVWPSDPWPYELLGHRGLGLLFLAIQIIALVFHLRWVVREKPRNLEFRNGLLTILSFVNGLGLTFVFMLPLSGSDQQLLGHILAGLAMAGIGLAIRAWPAALSGGVTLAIAIGHHFCLPYSISGMSHLALIDGLLLMILGLAATELISRFWKSDRSGREMTRLLAVFATLAAFCSLLLHSDFRSHSLLSYLVWTPMLPVILGIHSFWRDASGEERSIWLGGRTFAALFAGLILLIPVAAMKIDPEMISVATYLAAMVVIAACLITRDAVPLIAAAPLFLFGVFHHVQDWLAMNGPAPIWQVIVLTVIPLAGAALHRLKPLRIPKEAAVATEGGLHLLWMLPVLLSFQERLTPDAFVAAACGLGLLAFLAGLKLPFVALRSVSIAPVIAGVIGTLAEIPFGPLVGGLWVGFGLSFALAAAERATDRRDWFAWIAIPATIIIGLVATFETFNAPWDVAALAGFGLVLIGAWRWLSIPAAAPMALFVFAIAISRHVFLGVTGLPSPEILLVGVILAASLVGAGLLVSSAAAERFAFEELRPLAAWSFPLAALFIFLPTIAWDGIPGSEFATVWWGIAGSVVFLGGLLVRIQAHRIAGLLALGAGVIRMFLVDLDDTFGRIIAFGAVAVALLIIGYLYARFREFIEQEAK